MLNSLRHHPTLRGLLLGLALAAATLFSSVLGQTSLEGSFQRIVFAFAAGLLFTDLLERAGLRLKQEDRTLRDLILFGYATGAGFGVITFLQSWDPTGPLGAQLAVFGASGLFFGLFLTVFSARTKPSGETSPLAKHYDLSPPAKGGGFRQALEIWWLPVAVFLLAGLAIFPATDRWSEGYILFQVIFLMSLPPPLTAARGFASSVISPRTLGYATLFFALFFFGS